MHESELRQEIKRMLDKRGFWAYHPPDDIAKRIGFVSGRPDMFVLNPQCKTVIVEMKTFEPKARIEEWFDPAEISDAQRDFLDRWVYDAEGKGFLGIGTLVGNPRRMWMVPWNEWVEMEVRLATEGLKFQIKISDLPTFTELIWNKGEWKIPIGHPLNEIEVTYHELLWKKKPNAKAYSFRFEESK